MDYAVKVSDDGNVTMEMECADDHNFFTVMTPDRARTVARMLLTAAEGAQSIRSRAHAGMPERVTLDEMRGLG